MHIRDGRTAKAQAVSGLWLAATGLAGFFTVIALVTGWQLLRRPGGVRLESPVGRHPFIFGILFVASTTVLVVAVARWLKSAAHVLRVPGSMYLPVHNLEAASAWYRDTLGFFDALPDEDDEPGATVALVLVREGGVLTLRVIDPQKPGTDAAEPSVPTLYARNINKAREWLVSRGVAASPMQRDRQHTQYFEFRDLDGNLLEVSEDP
jgi:catechol 2,3-dioxygenase-like lactoylglutathione lyase family enzyme